MIIEKMVRDGKPNEVIINHILSPSFLKKIDLSLDKVKRQRDWVWGCGVGVAMMLLLAVFFWPIQPTPAVDLEKVGKALDAVKWVKHECEGGYWDGRIYWRRFGPEIFIRCETDGSVLVVRQNPSLALRYDGVKRMMESLDFNETSYGQNVASVREYMQKYVLAKFKAATDYRVIHDAQSTTYHVAMADGSYRLVIDARNYLPVEYIGPGFRFHYSYSKTGPVALLRMFGITNSR